jgi:Transposase DDE domain group 1
MGEKNKEALKLQFDKRLRLEFHGAMITSDAGLLVVRELDESLGLTEKAPHYLRDSRSISGEADQDGGTDGAPCPADYLSVG